MDINKLLSKALNSEFLSPEEGTFLYKKAELSELIYVGNFLRYKYHPAKEVTWIIDRNVNLSNICISSCKFCNFCRPKNHHEAFITTAEEYHSKITELFALGGNQLLLQGGLHPDFDLEFYKHLFHTLKSNYTGLKLHALGPPEIYYLSKTSGKSIENVLKELINSGLDSLPGAGAEILSDRVRKIISPVKCSSDQWLEVMRIAHGLNLTTSATMMFGHLETIEERVEHFVKLRDLQEIRPEGTTGFISFTSWPFQSKETKLEKLYGYFPGVSANEYIRMLAISRIMLPNIRNIQVSWLTVGAETAQLCLHAGANDMGSVMIEENVVSAAGNKNKISPENMLKLIKQAGFIPIRRNQQYEKEIQD